MSRLLDLAPLAAAVVAVPEFLPQLVKVRRSRDASGVSMSWAVLTSTNNGAWTMYFALSGFWTALVPSVSATLLAGALAFAIRRHTSIDGRRVGLIAGWVVLLVAATAVVGRAGLGTLLSVAFAVQVAPAIWVAYGSPRLTGVAVGTWLLVAGKLACWRAYGVHRHDPRLMTMGIIGITAAVLMHARVHATRIRPAPDRRGNAIDTVSAQLPTDRRMRVVDVVGGAA